MRLEAHGVNRSERREGQLPAIGRLHGSLNDARPHRTRLLAHVLPGRRTDIHPLPNPERNHGLAAARHVDANDLAAEIEDHGPIIAAENLARQ